MLRSFFGCAAPGQFSLFLIFSFLSSSLSNIPSYKKILLLTLYAAMLLLLLSHSSGRRRQKAELGIYGISYCCTWLDLIAAMQLPFTSLQLRVYRHHLHLLHFHQGPLYFIISVSAHTYINAYVANFYIIYVGISFWRRCDNDEDDGRCELPPGKKYAMVSLVSFNVQCVSLDHLFSLDSSLRVLLYIFTVSGDRCENKKLR